MPSPYEKLNDAIYDAALATRDKFKNENEAITIVYEQDGRYYFSDPQTTDLSNNRTKGEFKIPKGAVVRGIVHNHPEAADNDKFSPGDLDMAEQLDVPSAIIFGGNPTIRLFTPGKTKIQKTGPRLHPFRSSVGDDFTGTMR